MISLTRPALLAAMMMIVAGMVNPLRAAVTISGFVPFSTLDNGPLDEDPTVGVFAVSDTLVIDGTIDCGDAPPLPGGASGCPVTLVTGGDLILEAGGAIVTENNHGAGNGGDVTLEAAGDVVLHGPAGSLTGARISTARNTAANPGGSQHAGAIDVAAGGDVILEAGSVVSAAAAAGTAGAVQVLADGGVQIDGLVASGPTEIVDADALAGEVLVPAGAQQQGGSVTIRSTSTAGSGVVVGPTGIVVSQGDKEDAGLVLLEACGIEVRGLVASLTRDDEAAAVRLRSGEGLLVDGRDLGLPVDDPGFEGRLGVVRVGGSRGGSLDQRADLFARSDVQVLGPTPGSTVSFAVTAGPGTKPGSSGGTVTVLSLDGGISASGNAFEAGRSVSGDRGGSIDLQAAGDVALAGAVVSAVGNFGGGSPGTGGNVFVQSFQGDLLWTGGTGDVRPVGSGVPASRRGSIALFYCGSIDLTGSAFPTVGAPVPPFPEVFQDCSLPAPTLPPGESLPECNQPPVAADDDFTTDEDTAFGGDVFADNGHGADFDPGGDPLTVTEVNGVAADVGNLVVLPSGALLTLNADGTFTYDPNGQFEELAPGDEATDSFDYTVEEPGGLSDSATVTVAITGVDDDPVAVDDAATVAEDDPPTTIDVLANDTDVDGGPISIQSVTQPANGTVVITNAGADLTYEPDADYCNDGSPVDTFTYTLAPGGSTATVSVTVTCVDDPPVAVDDAATVVEDSGANTIDVLANDTDADGGPKTIQSVTQPANGTVTITNAGADLTYEPDADYCNDGSPLDTFTYTLNGGSTATVSVTVTCVDDPPVAVDDAATVVEDSGANTIDVLANDTDADGGPKTIQSVTQPANGTVAITNGGADLSYEPAASYCNDGSPTDDFTYTLNGGSTATVSVTVTCVNDPPVAGADAFDFVGNTELRVDTGTVATPHALETTGSGFGVLDNDADPVEGDDLAVTSITVGACTDSTGPTFDCTDPAVGTVHMQADGSFSFEPAAGDTGGSESFTYTATDDGTPPASAVAMVTLTRFERVWYVDPTAAGGGDGTSDSPFNALDTLDDAGGLTDVDLAGDYIFIHDGALSLGAPMELEASQHLVGEGVGLSIPVNLNGNGSPAVLVAAGTHPELTNGSGTAVTATEAIPTEIVGLSLQGSMNAIDLTTNTLLGGSSTLTIGSNIFRGAGAEGLDVTLDLGTGGTLTLEVENNAWIGAVAAHGGNAVDIVRVTGTLNLAFSGNTNIKSSANGVVIDGGFIVGSTITDFSGNSVHGDTLGAGVLVSKVTFDANAGTGGFQQVDGDNLMIGLSGDPVGGAGMALTTVQGNLFFDDLDIYAAVGTGLQVTGTGDGMTFAVTPATPDGSGTSVIDADNGAAVEITSATIDLRLDDLESNTSGSGVSLSSVGGQFRAPSGSSITKVSGGGTAFSVASSSATVNYGGTLNVTSGSGVGLTSNTGAVNFTGQLTLTTGANGAFSATGSSGTVTATHADNTLTTTTATALTVNGPDIGAGGLVFRSIAANGAPNGIVLQDTGATAGLTVNGTGTTDGSGGTIQNISGRGAAFINARNITLKNMNLTNTATSAGAPCGSAAVVGANTGCNAAIHLNGVTSVTLDNLNVTTSGQQGINGIGVTGFTLSNSVLSGLGNGADEDGLHFLNMLGTSNITNTSITGSGDDNVNIQNRSSTASTINITGGSFNTGVLGSGLWFGIRDSANTTINISGVTSDNNFSGGIVADAFDSSTMEITVSGSTITNNNDGIQVSSSQTSNARFDIDDNDFIGNDFLAVTLLKAAFSTGGALEGAVRNNNPITIGNGRTTDAISAFQAGGGALEVAITNNTFSYAGTQRVILVQAGQDGNGSLDATITGNAIDIQLDGVGNAVAGVLAQSAVTGPGVTSALCLDIGGAGGLSNTFTHSLGGAIAAGDIRVRQRNDGTVRLPGYAGAATDTGAVVTYLSGRNTVVSTPTATADSTGFAGGAACVQPTLP